MIHVHRQLMAEMRHQQILKARLQAAATPRPTPYVIVTQEQFDEISAGRPAGTRMAH